MKTGTFAEIMERWFVFVRPKVSDSTYYEYHGVVVRYLYHTVGCIPVPALCEAALMQALDSMEEKEFAEISPSTKAHVLTILRQILRYAAQEEGLRDIPLHCHVFGAGRRQGRCFDPRYTASLVSFCEKAGRPREYGVVLALFLGIRIGELCALQWSDIDLAYGIVHVRKTVKRVAPDPECTRTRYVIGAPKTESSYRDLPLSDFLWRRLSEFREEVTSESAYFLNGRTDRFVQPRSYEQSFKTWLRKCRIPDINVHSMRHSFATSCLMTGCDLKTLSEMLGHSSPTITLKMYVHSSMEEKRRAVNRISPRKPVRRRSAAGKPAVSDARKTDSLSYILPPVFSAVRWYARLFLYYTLEKAA